MYEGIPTKKKAPNEKSWAPKHKAVFGEEPRMVHESVFGKVGEDGKETPTSDKELADSAKVIRGNAPSVTHEKVFGKEERIQAPIHEKVFGGNEEIEAHERSTVLALRDELAGPFVHDHAEELFFEGRLTLSAFREILRQAVTEYDVILLPAAKELGMEKEEAELKNIESFRQALSDEALLKGEYDTWISMFNSLKKEKA